MVSATTKMRKYLEATLGRLLVYVSGGDLSSVRLRARKGTDQGPILVYMLKILLKFLILIFV